MKKNLKFIKNLLFFLLCLQFKKNLHSLRLLLQGIYVIKVNPILSCLIKTNEFAYINMSQYNPMSTSKLIIEFCYKMPTHSQLRFLFQGIQIR